MANPLELLDQLIAVQPESLKPILNHLSGMLKSSHMAFDTHVGENESIFGQVQTQLSSQGYRLRALETWTERAVKDGTEMRTRVDMLENRANEVASDGKKAVDTIRTQEANIAIIHDVVNTLGQSIMNFVSTLEVVKAQCDNLDAHGG